MQLEPSRIPELLSHAPLVPHPLELRREGAVFLIGTRLSPQVALETIFDSDCLEPVELFCFAFEDAAALRASAALVGLVKKNLRGFVLARFGFLPGREQLEFAYAQGVDLVDISVEPITQDADPLSPAFLAALAQAQAIFPRWAVAASLGWNDADPAVLTRLMDELARRKVVPLVALDAESGPQAAKHAPAMFTHLIQCWRRTGATLRPFHPLIALSAPLALPAPRTLVGNLLGRAQGARLRAGSDLRRLLRVREVEQSFDSAGL